MSFNDGVAADAVRDACAQAGLDCIGATLIRLGENALYHLPAADAVARVARTMDYWDAACKEVAVSNWLYRSGVVAARVVDIPQPVVADRHPVTFWRFIEGRQGMRSDIGALGSLLRDVHHLARPAGDFLPDEHVFDRVRPRVERSSIDTADKRFLLNRCDELAAELGSLKFTLPMSPIHGDAHIKNLMVSGERTFLIDFERFAWGHPEWDLAMTATEYATAGWWTGAEYAQFVGSYGGLDITQWSGFETLRAVHEIKMTTWIMQNIRESEEIAREFATRMVTLRTGRPTRDWKPF